MRRQVWYNGPSQIFDTVYPRLGTCLQSLARSTLPGTCGLLIEKMSYLLHLEIGRLTSRQYVQSVVLNFAQWSEGNRSTILDFKMAVFVCMKSKNIFWFSQSEASKELMISICWSLYWWRYACLCTIVESPEHVLLLWSNSTQVNLTDRCHSSSCISRVRVL